MEQNLIHNKIFIIFLIFILGFSLRILFAPPQNETADPFEILTAAKHLSESGKYYVPMIGSADLKISYHNPGWPVGYPLMLSGIFKLFGYNEYLARLFTIFLGSLLIVFTAIIADLFFREKVAYFAGLFAAIYPLLVAFNGRIFTNTPSTTFLFAALAFFLLSFVKRGEGLSFVKISDLFLEKRRLISFLASALLFGCLLAIRDTEIIFAPVFIYILYQSSILSDLRHYEGRKAVGKILFLSLFAFIAGLSPSIYYNLQNYGAPVVSATQKWGGHLDLNYLLLGTDSQMGMPGALIMLLTGLVYCFPLVSLGFIGKFTKKVNFFLVIFVLMFLPIIFVNGAYSVSSSGASPRYLLPLIPIVCVLTAQSLSNLSRRANKFLIGLLFIALSGWFVFFTYPAPIFYKISTKIAFIAHYAPAYQIFPYENYPSHINALAKWVRQNTPKDTVVLATSTQPYHFYYYAGRDVITFPNVTKDTLKNLVNKRPIFIVEDHGDIYNPEAINNVLNMVKEAGLACSEAGEVKLFSPRVGHTKMHIYQIIGKKRME